MKVIKRGTPPSEKIWTGTCGNCKSEMEEVESDLRNRRTGNQFDGPMAHETCPVCEAKFWIYPKAVVKRPKPEPSTYKMM